MVITTTQLCLTNSKLGCKSFTRAVAEMYDGEDL